MDETRAAAYQELIQTLLDCPNGEESAILNANSEFVDAGLIEKMVEVAEFLAERGENNAGWLRNFAAQLAEAIGISSTPTTSAGYFNLFMELLRATADSKGNPEVVYPLLRANQDKLDLGLAKELSNSVKAALRQLEATEVAGIAGVIFNFSNLMQEFPLGKRGDNLEIAIVGYEIALTVFTQAAFPVDWATTQNNLGAAYSDRIRGEKADNLELAIAAYRNSLEIYTLEAFPVDWAMTQNNLGNAYSDRIRGEKADNLELAIAAYRNSLEIYTREAFPVDWATTQNNLGAAYSNRIRGEKADNLELAIAAYRNSLEIYTREAFPVDWATTQNNLGAAYSNRIRGEKADNLEKAIAAYRNSLEIRTREAFPENWATTQNNLGIAYRNRIRGEKADNLEKAIAAYRNSLEIYTLEAFPVDWAMTQNNLGAAYSDRIRGEKADNLELAIAAYRNSLEIRTREAFPVDYIGTSFNLSLVYQNIKRFQDAEKILAPAIDTVESLREEILSGDEIKQKLAEEWHRIYLTMVEVSVALGKIPQALTYAEKSKTRNLVENILTRDKRNELQNQYLPIGANFNLAQFQASLPENTAILEWYITSDRILTFIIPPNRPLPNPLLQGEGTGNMPLNPVGAKHSGDMISGETDNINIGMLRPVTPERDMISGETDNINIGMLRPVTPERDMISGETDNINIGMLRPVTQESNEDLDNSKPPSPLRRGAGGEVSLWQSTPEDLDKLIDWANEYRYIYSENKEEWKKTLATRLHDLAKILNIDELLQREEIKSSQRLILIPHRYLHHFPIHALPVREGVGSGESGVGEENVNTQYLCDIFPQGVSYAPSCQIFLQAQQRQRPNFNQIFAIQTPTEDLYDADLGIIPAIKSQFNTATILKHDNATKANLLNHPQLTEANNLFFFCHGYFNSNSPLDSYLELADDNITVADIIANLKLENCRLVTLSACESGLPEIANSDEYLSLPYSFLLAGSTNVIATQWRVRSDATALLMLKFYQEGR